MAKLTDPFLYSNRIQFFATIRSLYS